jgi:hypothetical protein
MRQSVRKGVLGLFAGLATICLLSLPAAANTATLAFVNLSGTTPGTIEFFNADEESMSTWHVPSGVSCSTGGAGNVSLTLSGGPTSGSVTGSITTCRPFTFFGADLFCSSTTVTLGGTWSAVSTPGTFTATADAVSIIRRNTGTSPNCHSVATVFCTSTVTGYSLSGIISAQGTLPTLTTSDTVTLAGSTPLGNVTITGTATECGTLSGLNNGSIGFHTKMQVVSVP